MRRAAHAALALTGAASIAASIAVLGPSPARAHAFGELPQPSDLVREVSLADIPNEHSGVLVVEVQITEIAEGLAPRIGTAPPAGVEIGCLLMVETERFLLVASEVVHAAMNLLAKLASFV